MLADGMAQALRADGHTAEAVADGAHALLRLGDRDYDLLVLDLGLPRVSGERVLDALDRAGNDLPVLVVTAADGAIDVYVHRLRRKLEPHGLRISTVRGIGYALHDADPRARPRTGTSHEHGGEPPMTGTQSASRC